MKKKKTENIGTKHSVKGNTQTEGKGETLMPSPLCLELKFSEKQRDRDDVQKDLEEFVKTLTKKEKEQLRTFAFVTFEVLGWPYD